MHRQTFAIGVALSTLLLAGPALAQTAVVKAKKNATRGVAGAVAVSRPDMSKLAIYGSFGFGFQCAVGETANVHSLGWIPQDVAITVDFESTDESDPIATLSSIQFKDFAAGGERFSSDDDGGDLNPYFRLMKPYAANWVLTVGAADGGVACYSYKVTLQ